MKEMERFLDRVFFVGHNSWKFAVELSQRTADKEKHGGRGLPGILTWQFFSHAPGAKGAESVPAPVHKSAPSHSQSYPL